MAHSAGNQKWAPASTGFRKTRPGLWLRPDDLRRTGILPVGWLNELGLSDEQLMLQEKDYRLLDVNYCTTKLDQQYLDLVWRLERRADSLQEKFTPPMIKSFTLGGEVHRLIAKDPYRSAELQGPRDRKRLWHTMLRYDELRRRICSPAHSNIPTSITSFG
jgi:hypothetical protein